MRALWTFYFILPHPSYCPFNVEYLFLLYEVSSEQQELRCVVFPHLILILLEHSPYFMMIGCLNHMCAQVYLCVRRPEVNLKCHPSGVIHLDF